MKKIFYYTDVTPLLGRGDAAIEKMIRNLKTFKAASGEIKLVWHPWSGTEYYLELNDSDVIERYHRIVEEYRTEAWGDMDESSSFDKARETLLTCDGYYGDVSDLVYEAQKAGIPVMLQDIDV